MIAAGELRGGNYLMTNSYYAKITAEDIYLIESGNIKFLQPVPINPEILKKCGFEFLNGLYKKTIVPWSMLVGMVNTKKMDTLVKLFNIFMNSKTFTLQSQAESWR